MSILFSGKTQLFMGGGHAILLTDLSVTGNHIIKVVYKCRYFFLTDVGFNDSIRNDEQDRHRSVLISFC